MLGTLKSIQKVTFNWNQLQRHLFRIGTTLRCEGNRERTTIIGTPFLRLAFSQSGLGMRQSANRKIQGSGAGGRALLEPGGIDFKSIKLYFP